MQKEAIPTLRPRRMGINTHSEPVAYLRADCPVCRSEGFEAHTRVMVQVDEATIIATLNIVYGDELLGEGDVGLSEAAWARLAITDGKLATLTHTRALDSMSHVRSKIYGNRLTHEGMEAIVDDIVAGNYSDIHLSAFLTASAGDRLDLDEMTSLTDAMVKAGSRIDWSKLTGHPSPRIMDKHCLGGLPGNRTTPIVVSIAAANGLIIPKTSSRAITSPAGTADTMETLTRVTLSEEEMRAVVEKESGCLVWGGAVSLSPADDILIRVERALDIDSEGQMVASVLSKKIAAGSTHVLIDIPVGATAKVRSAQAAKHIAHHFEKVGEALGIKVRTLITDGSQPVGNGIGPALEALDVLAVLSNAPDAPEDLRHRAIQVAGALLEMGEAAAHGEGPALARKTLASGRALEKMKAICEAQGGLLAPKLAHHKRIIVSERNGIVSFINNRLVARLAKLAGAPAAKGAGVYLHTHLGHRVEKGDAVMTVYAETPGELAYAFEFYESHPEMLRIEDESI
ncbi:MAG: thymidine phosphorylase family protein [Moraxellaceae bacterium]|jgi:thymidine phosphorylase|nr:thymidine phosphorylase family protein [Moraxellaceae bacterium]MBP9046189.1 thymidine phosphorylase family protein [Moraxellaceae bacterium]MCC6200940.1 thymidine phosphorylase family protein [Moraxellaceae bacterium]HQV41517.1 thymidine phosphorylase family protein [Moraxellaceae bacterium]HQX89490.1 thymidine phosphorylase family protein [Moraxellaceae bacterium]